MAGALPVSSLESFLRPFLLTQTFFCPGTPPYENLLTNAKSFADVYLGSPTLQDPSKACDGVSFGFGFDMAPTSPPSRVGAEPRPATGSCADAGR
jgi:hypothetical protein